MSDQPDALRLADALQACVQTHPQMSEDEPGGYDSWQDELMDYAAAELRRQHEEIERLREYADTLVRERNAAWAESAELRRRAELFDALQNMPVEEAQAYFWNYSSRKARAKAIRDRTGRDDADAGGGDA